MTSTHNPALASVPPVSLYIHWPFCKFKCPYCDFNSHVRDQVDEAAFVSALLRELDYMLSLTGTRRLMSIFFGGGTPSLMSGEAVKRLLSGIVSHPALVVPKEADALEITLEANPTSAEASKFRAFRSAGVNRVSLGVQSLNAESLAFLGRQHSADEALDAVAMAADIFPRYSFDLIYALPHQSLSQWEKELTAALAHARDHLSVYQLTIEEKTAFHHAYHQQKAFVLPVEDQAADLYELTQQLMEARGLPAYEISNHAAQGCESQHNLSYWLGREYIGIGPGAHGRLHLAPSETSISPQMVVATNTLKSPELWLEAVQQRGHGIEASPCLTPLEYHEERVMMRLRMTGPIPYTDLPALPPMDYLAQLQSYGLIQLHPEHFNLTRKGLLLQQNLVSEILAHIA